MLNICWQKRLIYFGELLFRIFYPVRIKYFGILLGLLLLLLGLTPTAWAIPVSAVPNPRQINGSWVTDMAAVLSPKAEELLNKEIFELEAKTSIELAVVTVPDTIPEVTPKLFATHLFKTWGIGKADQNNGLLLLISLADRRVEIETGYGLETRLPTSLIHQVIEAKILPHFKKQDFENGVLTGTQALIAVLTSTYINPPADDLGGPMQGLWVTIGLLSLGLLGISWSAIANTLFPKVTWLEPTGTSRTESSRSGTIKCAVCKHPMQAVAPEIVLTQLTPAQQVAQELGSIQIEGWQCLTCVMQSPNLGWHLRTYIRNDHDYHRCPICEELTLIPSYEELEPPQVEKPGKQRVTETCTCCGYTEQREEAAYQAKKADSDWVDDSYVYQEINYDSGMNDSGGSSFGGGDTGGGGDGGSW